MLDNRTEIYSQKLAELIRHETISYENQYDKEKFYSFQEDFNGSLLLRWKGSSSRAPVMLMNHHDVVEAPGNWTYPPFSGTIADGKLWERGTLDTKCGLWMRAFRRPVFRIRK